MTWSRTRSQLFLTVFMVIFHSLNEGSVSLFLFFFFGVVGGENFVAARYIKASVIRKQGRFNAIVLRYIIYIGGEQLERETRALGNL